MYTGPYFGKYILYNSNSYQVETNCVNGIIDKHPSSLIKIIAFHALSLLLTFGIHVHLQQYIEAELRKYALVNWATIGSDNGLSPGRRQAIIWTNAGILLIGPLWTNLGEILIEIIYFLYIFIHVNAFKNVVWEMAVILSLP